MSVEEQLERAKNAAIKLAEDRLRQQNEEASRKVIAARHPRGTPRVIIVVYSDRPYFTKVIKRYLQELQSKYENRITIEDSVYANATTFASAATVSPTVTNAIICSDPSTQDFLLQTLQARGTKLPSIVMVSDTSFARSTISAALPSSLKTADLFEMTVVVDEFVQQNISTQEDPKS